MAVLPLGPTPSLIFPGRTPGINPNHVAYAPGANLFSAVASGANFISLLSAAAGTATSMTKNIDSHTGPSNTFGTKIVFPGTTTCPSSMTLAVIGRFSGNNFVYGALSTSATAAAGVALGINQAVANPLRFSFGGSSGIDSTIGLTSGVPYFVVMSANVSNSSAYLCNFVTVRLDNGQIKSQAVSSNSGGSGTFTAAQSGGWSIGTLSTGSFSWAGKLSAVMGSPVYLSVPQLLEWSADPWSFWYP